MEIWVKKNEKVFWTITTIVIQIMLLLGLWDGGYCEIQEDFSKPGTRFRFNELNLKHDHCAYPEVLDRDLWTCVCPMPLTKMGRDCICLGCMAEVLQDKYWEKTWDSFVDFAQEELEEEREEGENEDRETKSDFKVGSSGASSRDVRQVPEEFESPVLILQSGETKDENFFSGEDVGKHEISARRLFRPDSNYLTVMTMDGSPSVPKVLRPCRLRSSECFNNNNEMNVLWLKKKPKMINLGQIETFPGAELERNSEVPPQSNVQVPQEISTEQSTEPAVVWEPPKNESGSFSDSVIFGETSGSAFFGADKAVGTLSAYKGTGSIALGATNGSGAAVGFTGEGSSHVGIQSDGAEASGSTIVGPNARKASSTMIMMAGEGDAVATNTLTDDASASAVALATQGASGSSSAAFGAAVAGAAAAPGKGDAAGSSGYGTDTSISATVKGRNMVSETLSVGNANDSLREALATSHSKDKQTRERTSQTVEREKKNLEFSGDETEPDNWF